MGVVIAIVLFLVVLVGMVIILYMLWDRFSFIKEHGGPPPSRKGSMRLVRCTVPLIIEGGRCYTCVHAYTTFFSTRDT